MTWSAIDFDWNQARAFLATATEGSLSAAARKLGLIVTSTGQACASSEEQVTIADDTGSSGRDLVGAGVFKSSVELCHA